MNIFSKLFGKKSGQQSAFALIEATQARAIPEADLSADTNFAKSRIEQASMGGTIVGISPNNLSQILFVSKQSFSQNEILALRTAIEQGNVRIQIGYKSYPTYPIFLVKPTIMDNPSNPFWLETFPNIGLPDDKTVVQKLTKVNKLRICFHFYKGDTTLLFKAGYEAMFAPPNELISILSVAENYLNSIPSSRRTYSGAMNQFFEENP